jgi:hypothetical protein
MDIMDKTSNSTETQEKLLRQAENGCKGTRNGWVRGDDDMFYNLSHFSKIGVEKNHHWGGWSVVGLCGDCQIYIKTFPEWGLCATWLLNVMEDKKNE